MRVKNVLLGLAGVVIASTSGVAQSVPAQKTDLDPPRLYPQIALSRTHIAFVDAGDIWIVSRNGGSAVRITSGPQDDTNPSFSPDGQRIAFSRAVGGDSDIYVISARGGHPTRLTFHPAAETVRSWSPDGSDILFSSARTMSWQSRLYTVPSAGGPTRPLPIRLAWNGVFAPDGRIVFAPREVIGRYAASWPGYRGGSMGALELADLSTGSFRSLSTDAGNDRLPAWAGERLLIASDRAGGSYNVYALDVASGQARPITQFTGQGIGALAGAPDGTAAFVRDGRIFLLDPATGRFRRVPAAFTANRDALTPHQVAAAKYIDDAAVGSNGEVALAARGDVLLIDPAGQVCNLTASSTTTDSAPVFSPDGLALAYLSFDAGGDRLVIRDRGSNAPRRTITLPAERGGYFEPRWSPDGRRMTLMDNRAGLWLIDLKRRSTLLLDRGTHMNDFSFEPSWSPDGGWIAYAKYLANNHRALFLRNVVTGAAFQLTSGEVDVGTPRFDPAGKQLYFLASGNAAPAEAFGMYPAVLRPLILRTIQAAAIDLTQSGAPLRQSLSAAAFSRRIRALPYAPRDYASIAVLADGALLAEAKQWPSTPGGADPTSSLYRLGASPETGPTATDVDQFALSPDAKQWLVNSGGKWMVQSLLPRIADRIVTLDDVKMSVDPGQEWAQIYRETWRAMADTFYDPAHHGQDVAALQKHYARYLPGISRRSDLTALLYQALGNVAVSHIAFAGGDTGTAPPPLQASGLLGADFTLQNGRFRFAKIYRGDPFHSEAEIVGPLDRLDPAVMAGDYLLAVNGVDASVDRDLLFYLLGTAGHPTTLTIAKSADGRGSRTVTVTPLTSDAALRQAAWVADNRAAVDKRSQGTVGYVYIPDFQEQGINAFLRQWTAASDKDGVVIDQRHNPGGWAADFIFDFVKHRPIAYYAFRDANDLPYPVIGNAGPRALLVNERNGSAADTFPWTFQRSGLGPIVGHRTAGWGIGHLSTVRLVDGGELSLPLRAFFNPAGSWDIENRGVIPDIAVDTGPMAAIRGEDAQLNSAVDAVLALRQRHPSPPPRHPPPFVYQN